jgi:hypothetical protein
LQKDHQKVIHVFLIIEYMLNLVTIAITRKLCNTDAKGNFREVRSVIEFTIASLATSTEVAEAQMDEAVDQGTKALEHMNHAPPTHGAEGAVTDTISVINDIGSIAVAWEPLLQKIKLFTKIVDEIAEV